jgi:hypothetical protein
MCKYNYEEMMDGLIESIEVHYRIARQEEAGWPPAFAKEEVELYRSICLAYIEAFGEYRTMREGLEQPETDDLRFIGLFWALNMSRMYETILNRSRSGGDREYIEQVKKIPEVVQFLGSVEPELLRDKC